MPTLRCGDKLWSEVSTVWYCQSWNTSMIVKWFQTKYAGLQVCSSKAIKDTVSTILSCLCADSLSQPQECFMWAWKRKCLSRCPVWIVPSLSTWSTRPRICWCQKRNLLSVRRRTRSKQLSSWYDTPPSHAQSKQFQEDCDFIDPRLCLCVFIDRHWDDVTIASASWKTHLPCAGGRELHQCQEDNQGPGIETQGQYLHSDWSANLQPNTDR